VRINPEKKVFKKKKKKFMLKQDLEPMTSTIPTELSNEAKWELVML